MIYLFQITFINYNGNTVKREVEARNPFEAIQLSDAFGRVVISVVNCDL